MTTATHTRDAVAAWWVAQVAHYSRGELTIHMTGQDGGSAGVRITEDGRVLRPSGFDITDLIVES